MTNAYFENLINEDKQNLTRGKVIAYLLYKHRTSEVLILNSFLWDSDVSDFINTLRQAGVKSFVYTNTSTAVMDNFHAFIENGCKFVEACIVANVETGKKDKGFKFEL